MKRLLVFLAALGLSTVCFAANDTSLSSFTATNDSAVITVPGSGVVAHVLSRILVSSTSAIGTIKIFNSTFTTTNPVATIHLGTVFMYDFDNLQLKGIFYTTTSNTNGVTIIYKQ